MFLKIGVMRMLVGFLGSRGCFNNCNLLLLVDNNDWNWHSLK